MTSPRIAALPAAAAVALTAVAARVVYSGR
jgi:hypothetical protein